MVKYVLDRLCCMAGTVNQAFEDLSATQKLNRRLVVDGLERIDGSAMTLVGRMDIVLHYIEIDERMQCGTVFVSAVDLSWVV